MRADAMPRGLPWRRQRGQALVETALAATVLVPLLIGIALVGKLIDLRHATVTAARTLAFECAVRLDECSDASGRAVLTDELRRRLLMRDDREVLADDAAPDRPAAAERRAGWNDRAGRPMLARLSGLQADVRPQRLDGPQGNLANSGAIAARGALTLLNEVAGPPRFGLRTWDGLQSAQVRLDLTATDLAGSRNGATGNDAGAGLPLRMQGRTAILADGWAASGPEGSDGTSVRERVEAGWRLGAAEAGIDAGYAAVRGLLATMHALGLEPAADASRYHRVDVDVVPADRRPAQ